MRTRIDFWMYHIKYHLGDYFAFAVNLFLLAVTLVKERPQVGGPAELAGALPVIAFFAFNVIWSAKDLISVFAVFKGYKHTVITDSACEIAVSPSHDDEKAGYTVRESVLPGGGLIVSSRRVDSALIADGGAAAVYDKQADKKVREFIREHRDHLFPFLYKQYRASVYAGNMLFNQRKLCLSSNLLKGLERGSVKVHGGCYFDSFLTNIISKRAMTSGEDVEQVVIEGTDYFPEYESNGVKRLKSLHNTVMNNEIGISTIGITEDDHILIWRQNRNVQSGAGLLAPSGSGSCDFSDYEKKKHTSFRGVIEYAMQRELWEESSGKSVCRSSEEFGQTRVIGFFRWMNKGGKPEFVGVTKINCTASELKANHEEVSEAKGVVLNHISVDNTAELRAKLIGTEDAPGLLLAHAATVSLPLQVCIERLVEYLEDDSVSAEERAERERFVFG